MTDEKKKRLSEKPFLIYLLAFSFLVVLLTSIAIFDRQGLILVVGTYFLYGGVIVATIGFGLLNKGTNDGGGDAQSTYMKSDEHFKRGRKQEKPFERVVWAVILAAISIAALGYLLNQIMAG